MVLGTFRPQNFEEGKRDDNQRGKGRKRTKIGNGNAAGRREKMHQKIAQKLGKEEGSIGPRSTQTEFPDPRLKPI